MSETIKLPVLARQMPNDKWTLYDAEGKAVTGWGQVTMTRANAKFLEARINADRTEQIIKAVEAILRLECPIWMQPEINALKAALRAK